MTIKATINQKVLIVISGTTSKPQQLRCGQLMMKRK